MSASQMKGLGIQSLSCWYVFLTRIQEYEGENRAKEPALPALSFACP